MDLQHHRATRFSPEVTDWVDVILTMTQSHKDAVLRTAPAASGKTFTLAEYSGAGGEIQDPMSLGTEPAYERCAEQLASLMPQVLDRLRSASITRG
jgi:protein-tyrosine-phosphatase